MAKNSQQLAIQLEQVKNKAEAEFNPLMPDPSAFDQSKPVISLLAQLRNEKIRMLDLERRMKRHAQKLKGYHTTHVH